MAARTLEKAQSAMEYLITYSWAILIIAVALGALYALGLFTPGAFVQDQCIFPANFGCLSGFLYANGSMVINFEQSTPTGINITAVGCNEEGYTTNMTAFGTPVYLPIGGNATLSAYCYSNGSIATSQPGSLYKGYFIINYTSLDTGFQHVLLGQIVEKST